MRHSIRFKLTCLLTSLIVVSIFAIWFINRTFLSDYYRHNKIETLSKVYAEVERIYVKSNEEIFLSEEDAVRIEKLSSYHNVNIYVIMSFAGEWKYNYPMPFNIGNKEKQQIEYLVRDYLNIYESYVVPEMFRQNYGEKTLIENKDKYMICSLYDNILDTNYIDLVGVLGKDKIIFVRSNFESIQESVAVANSFLAYIGIVVVVIGMIAMLIITKRFTKPIHQLADLANKMSNLDFEVKYKVQSKDEIAELGTSINTLSDKLESTISELKSANNELMKDIQKKTEIDEMRREFLSNVSHELKTPISLIQGYAEGLKENIYEDSETRDFYCEVIMDEADKMNKLVMQLLSLNQLESGSNQINMERFDLVRLIRTTLDATEILFKQKNVTLRFDETEAIYVWADEFLIQQVLTNYISNALNHLENPNIIEIKLIQYSNVIRTAVFNTGDPIPEEDLDKVWIKFFKVDKARTREYGGSGVGLSIVKAIMNSLNRECGVVNHSSGVEFWFELDTKA